MVAAGFVEEVRRLVAAGYGSRAPPLNSDRLQEVASFMRGEITWPRRSIWPSATPEAIGQASVDLVSPRSGDVTWVDAHRGAEQALMRFEEFFLTTVLNPRCLSRSEATQTDKRSRRVPPPRSAPGDRSARSSGSVSRAIRRVRRHSTISTALFHDFFELHGDRRFADDGAIVAGFGYFKRSRWQSWAISGAVRPPSGSSETLAAQSRGLSQGRAPL